MPIYISPPRPSNGVHDILLTLLLRPQQREIIVAALDGKDVFVQAATSFGKSLCFQLPACTDHGSKHPKLPRARSPAVVVN